MPRARTPKNGTSRTKNVATPDSSASTAVMDQEMTQAAIPHELEAEIRRRAYELYEQRGCTPGHEREDWAVAEREVMARYNHQLTV